jgi:hypothetical protein
MTTERDLELPMVRILERDLSGRLSRNSPNTQVVNTARGNVVGGTWRKPDIVLLAIHKFVSRASPELTLTGFELKIANNFDVTSVYQAHAYTRFLHHAYVVVHYPTDISWPSALADIRGHAQELGIGIVRLTSIDGDGRYEIVLSSQRREPQPHRVDEFINDQLPGHVGWLRDRMR